MTTGEAPPGGTVVYVVERFPERSQTFVQNELREMLRRGVPITVYSLYPADDADPDAADLDFRRLESSARHPGRLLAALAACLRLHPRGTARLLGLAAVRPSRLQIHAAGKALQLVAGLGGAAPARFHAHFARVSASVAMLASTATGAPFSFTAHGADLFVRPMDMRRKLRRADVVVTVCDYNRRFVAEHWPAVGTVAVVPCGVDPGAFRRQRPYRRDPYTIVAVGRLVPKKGFADLVRACALLRDRGVDFRCRIVGRGPLHGELTALIDRLAVADHVELAGPGAGGDVRRALEAASVFCLPAVVAPDGDRDSQPVVVKEAMAMAVPVVATDEVGIPEMVDADTGLLVPPGRPDELAAALAAAAAMDAARLAAMGAAGRRRAVERFSLASQADGLLRSWDGSATRSSPH